MNKDPSRKQLWFFIFYLIFGFSAKITLTAGTVLGVLYGGNTAIAVNPTGTNARAEISVWILDPQYYWCKWIDKIILTKN